MSTQPPARNLFDLYRPEQVSELRQSPVCILYNLNDNYIVYKSSYISTAFESVCELKTIDSIGRNSLLIMPPHHIHQRAPGEAAKPGATNPPAPPSATPATNLIAWLTDPKMDEYHGRSYVLRNEVLMMVITGQGNLAEISRRHKITRAAMTRHMSRARQIFLQT